ncbi:MAG: N-acetylmuramoyl-L-alanine amidase [Actinomycetota bacterium]
MRGRRGTWALAAVVVVGTAVPVAEASQRVPSTRTVAVPDTLSATLTAGQRVRAELSFAATHVVLSWRGREASGVAYRTVGTSGEMSPWRRAPEAHDLEHGDHHYSGVLAVGRAESVEWRPAGRAHPDDVRIDYLNTVDGPERIVRLPAEQDQPDGTPDIVTRAEWGADESLKDTTGACERDFFNLQQLFVHHTAGTNFDDNPAATMRAIYHYHVVSRGWCDVGYNFVIAPDGSIFEGRWARSYRPWETHTSETRGGKVVAGAHVADYNSGSLGVSVMGNYSQVAVPPEARRSLAEILAWKADRHDLDPQGTHTYVNPESGLHDRLPVIAGHRDAGSTECPGNKLYAVLDDVRDDTAAAMGEGKADSRIQLAASARRAAYRDRVSYTGNLRDASGVGLAGREVTLYRRNGTRAWKQEAVLVTGLDGAFSHVVTARANVGIVAVYAGDDSMWGDQSRLSLTKVAPDVTLTAEGGSTDATGVHHYPRGTSKVSLAGTVMPHHAGNQVVIEVDEVQPDGSLKEISSKMVVIDSTGSFRSVFKVPHPDLGGSFQADARFVHDDDHAASTSPPVSFTVD